MKKIDPHQKIILDADVIIHFCKGDAIGLLPKIFPNRLCVPDVVYKEALSMQYKIAIDNLFHFKLVDELVITSDLKVFKEYNQLIKRFGKGESACMAYCKYHKDVVGSSNLRDVVQYCNENGIVYLCTLDFLYEAYRIGLMDEADCDFFIYNVKSKGSRLPVDTIADFIISMKKSF